jgi:hypothetical protein
MNEGSIGSPRKSDSPSHEQNKSFEINLQKAWEDKIIGLDRHLKDYPLEKLLALESLLAQVPEEQVKSEFERIARVPVGYSDMNEYEQTFVQALVTSNVAARDRAALVRLFSSKAPEFMCTVPMVLYLSNSGISDPLLILFDSYDTTSNVQTKKDLLSILGHAFRSIRDKSTGDDEFVSQSKEWYLQNHAKLEINPYYHPDTLFPENRELFKSKTKP